MTRTKSAKRVRFDRWGYFFVTPFVLIFLLFQLYPIIYTFFLGFTNMHGSSTSFDYVGFNNFVKSSYTVQLDGIPAAKADALTAALKEKNIDGETDAPAAPDESNNAFDLSSASPAAATDATAAPAASAPADPFSLSDDTPAPPPPPASKKTAGAKAVAPPPPPVSTETYYVKVTQLSPDMLATLKTVLLANGIAEQDITKGTKQIYAGLVFDDKFWQAFGNTWIIWFFNFIPQLGFALLFAVWFTDLSLKLRGTGFFKTIYYLPNVITAVSVAVLFASLFGYPTGPINQFLVHDLGLKDVINFYRSELWTRGIVSFIQFWMWFGSTIIVLTAGIVAIPESLFESAVVDGATSTQVFSKITVPLLRPVMSFVLVTSLIGGMQMFDIPYLITDRLGNPNGSINTTAMYLFTHAFSSANNYSYAATISIGMFLLVLVLAMMVFFTMRDKDEAAANKLRRLAK